MASVTDEDEAMKENMQSLGAVLFSVLIAAYFLKTFLFY